MRPFLYALIYLLFSFPGFSQESHAIDSLKERIEVAPRDSLRVNLLDDLCWEYLYNDPQKSIPYAREAIALAKDLGFKKGEGRLLNTLGVAFSNLMDFQQALNNYQQALKVKEEIGDESGMATSLINIGNTYQHLGDYDKAIAFYTKGLPIFEKGGKRQNVATTYNNIASVYERQGNYENELIYATKSLEIAQELGYDAGIMDSKISIGNVHKAQQNYAEALNNYDEALEMATRIRDLFGMAMCHHNIAAVYKSLGKPEEALNHYRIQLQMAEELNSPNDRLYASMGIGETYLMNNDLPKSLTFLSNSLILSRELGARDETKQIYDDLSSLYERKKDYSKALSFHKLFVDLKDSLFNETRSKQINELTIKYETEKKQNEITILNKNNLLQLSEISKERLLRNVSIAGLVLILALALLLYKNNRERRATNQLLTLQKQELQEANAIKTKLFSVISHDLRSPLTSLHGLLQIMEEKGAPDLKPLISHGNGMMSNAINLLDNLLYWSANQVKGITMHFTRVSLAEIVEENFGLFSPIANAKGITMNHELKTEDHVYADVSSVHLVFRNLISNALKFTPAGGRITISRVIRGSETEISVMDTGTGITPVEQAKLFSGDQASTRGTSNEKGTGLGLLLCKEFVEKNGGKIWVESGRDGGTIFKFTLKTYVPSGDPPLNRFTTFLSNTKA